MVEFADVGIDSASLCFEFLEVRILCVMKRTSKWIQARIGHALLQPRVVFCTQLSKFGFRRVVSLCPKITSFLVPEQPPFWFYRFCGMFLLIPLSVRRISSDVTSGMLILSSWSLPISNNPQFEHYMFTFLPGSQRVPTRKNDSRCLLCFGRSYANPVVLGFKLVDSAIVVDRGR
jgi:hypothetical protein